MEHEAQQVQVLGTEGLKGGNEVFGADDIALLRDAISLHPDLEAAACLTKLILPHVGFPIDSPETLIKSLRAGRCELRMRQQAWTSREIKRFMPSALFPIVDPADLLRKVLIACSSGRRFHYHEQQARLCCAE